MSVVWQVRRAQRYGCRRLPQGILAAAVAATALTFTAAGAAAAYDMDADGYGFVGKGKVQSVLGWNNKQLQANAAAVSFSHVDVTVSAQAWECTNANNDKVQYRRLITTTTTTDLLDAAARSRKQVNGFVLTGVGSTSTDVTYATEGFGCGDGGGGGGGGCGGGDGHDDGTHHDGAGQLPEVNRCPCGTPWSLTRAAGDPEVLERTTGLYVVVGDDVRLLVPDLE